MALAARANPGSSALAMTISNPLRSSDMRPRVSPEKRAEKTRRMTIRKYWTPGGMPPSF